MTITVENDTETYSFNTIATTNNYVIICDIDGMSILTKNGMNDLLPPDNSLVGTYSDGVTQYEISVEEYNDIQYGKIVQSGTTSGGYEFIMVNNQAISLSDPSLISISTSGGDTILSLNGNNYTKQQ